MNPYHILDALELIDETYIAQAKEGGAVNRSPAEEGRSNGSRRRAIVLAAAVAALLALCGFAAYGMGLFDPWLQKPSGDPVETVRDTIENQLNKGYTISVDIEAVAVDEEETRRAAGMYAGSGLAGERGWSGEYLAEHFVAVRARYYAAYDHTKTFRDDGYIDQYFYLTCDEETQVWTIVDNSTDGAPDGS